jgi:hypothetical protein
VLHRPVELARLFGTWIAALMLVALLGNGNGFSARQL